MSQIERTYGNDSTWLNARRRFHIAEGSNKGVKPLGEIDCISCIKHITGKIPNKKQCHNICGKG
jgi:hypothetical protein